MYRFILAANSIRNKLAHTAEVADLDQRIDAMLKLLASPEWKVAGGLSGRHNKIRGAFTFACGSVAGYASAFRDFANFEMG